MRPAPTRPPRPDDLAATHAERDVPDTFHAADAIQLEAHMVRAPRGGVRARRVERRPLAPDISVGISADHQPDQRRAIHRPRFALWRYAAPSLSTRDAIGELEDFVEAV